MTITHGGNIFSLARQLQCEPAEILDFSASINPLGMAAGVKEAIVKAIDRVAHYPEQQSHLLNDALASQWGVKTEYILTGNGATDLIHFVGRAPWPARGDAPPATSPVTLLIPTFSEFHRAYPQAKLVRRWEDLSGFGVVTRPNNPFGTILPIEALESKLSEGHWLLVDESWFFAIAERPHEAVMWYSALPDLLAMTFSLTAIHGLLSWLDGRRPGLWLLGLSFGLGLLSKESAVAMLAFLALILLFDLRATRLHWLTLVPLTAAVVLYTALIFAAGDHHLHLSDGTFTFGWHAVGVLLASSARLLCFWGVAAFALLLCLQPVSARQRRTVTFALLWIVPALAPYSFLSYMGTVPSRHAYLANLGVALLAGTSMLA